VNQLEHIMKEDGMRLIKNKIKLFLNINNEIFYLTNLHQNISHYA
jgi:hypothetical protein